MSTSDVRILATGTALPGPAIDNAALARRFGMDPLWEQWVDTFVGTRGRHLSFDLESGKATGGLADLGAEAGRAALDAADLTAGDIDAVVMGTATPDLLMPATVNMIADRLGVDGVPTYQLQSGCTGAVQALALARQLLASGEHRTVLALAGDTCGKYFETDADYGSMPPAQLVNLVLFGDGAGAAVLTAEPVAGTAVLRHAFTRLVGAGREPGHVLDWFGPADRDERRPGVYEDYKAVEALVPGMARDALDEVLDAVGWSRGEVDFLLPPQLSGRMTERIVAGFGLEAPEEVTVVDEVGNSGNALPFLQLDRLLRRMAEGDRAVGVAVESSKWIKAGFALERM